MWAAKNIMEAVDPEPYGIGGDGCTGTHARIPFVSGECVTPPDEHLDIGPFSLRATDSQRPGSLFLPSSHPRTLAAGVMGEKSSR